MQYMPHSLYLQSWLPDPLYPALIRLPIFLISGIFSTPLLLSFSYFLYNHCESSLFSLRTFARCRHGRDSVERSEPTVQRAIRSQTPACKCGSTTAANIALPVNLWVYESQTNTAGAQLGLVRNVSKRPSKSLFAIL